MTIQSPEIERRANTPTIMRCPACQAGGLEVLFEIAQIPILCNVLCSTRESALAVPRGQMRLGFCRACGHVYNTAFDAELMRYDATYENTLQFSPRFQTYLETLASGLIERHDLRNKSIVEIGCGQGDFISLLCALGHNRGIGFDPSFDASKVNTSLSAGVEIVPEYFAVEHANRAVNMLCCHHVLEHVPQPLEFLRQLVDAIRGRRDTVVFFEVPNAMFTLDGLGIWDIIYEHCSYFTPASLRRVFEAAGLEVMHLAETFDGQFLTSEARLSGSLVLPTPISDGLVSSINRFSVEYDSKLSYWRAIREKIRSDELRAVIWGAGSKGVTFLNVMSATHELIPYAIDVNPRKHGQFVVGTGQEIVPPEFLVDYRPHLVIVMNGIYKSEIAAACQEMGLSSELIVAS